MWRADNTADGNGSSLQFLARGVNEEKLQDLGEFEDISDAGKGYSESMSFVFGEEYASLYCRDGQWRIGARSRRTAELFANWLKESGFITSFSNY